MPAVQLELNWKKFPSVQLVHAADIRYRGPGIYCITCTANGKIYIGSTKNLRDRAMSHLSFLRRGKGSSHLQNAFNKYGEHVFVFCVVQRCGSTQRIKLEQRFLDNTRAYDHSIGFNISSVAGSVSGNARAVSKAHATPYHFVRGTKHYRGTNVWKFSKRVGVDASGLYAVRVGRVRCSSGFSLPTVIRKKHRIVSPDGKTYSFFSVRAFEKKHGVTAKALLPVLKGTQAQHRGWRLPGTKIVRRKVSVLRSPSGKLHYFVSHSKFAKRYGLSQPQVSKLLKGEHYLQVKGWTRPDAPLPEAPVFRLLSPQGKVHTFSNILRFAKQHGMHATQLGVVLKGGTTHRIVKGWTLPIPKQLKAA